MTSANGRPDILISSGNYFDYLEPQNNRYDIEDIAWSLSRLCRFAGHISRKFDDLIYSVAQHCVLVSRLVPPEQALAGLLHDAAESFLVDIPRPLKQLLPDYKSVETRIEAAVLTHFGLPYPMSPEIHRADRIALYLEQRDIMPKHTDKWSGIEIVQDALCEPIQPLSITASRELFLARYRELTS